MKRMFALILVLVGLGLIPVLTETRFEWRTKRWIRSFFCRTRAQGNHKQYDLQKNLHMLYNYIDVQIAFLGDSHTQFADWNRLLPDIEVAGFGISGDTTAGMLARIEQIIAVKPQICFIMAGINDITRGFDMHQIEQNYRSILARLSQAGIKPVVFSTLYVSSEYRDASAVNNKVDRLNDFLQGLGYPFIDMTGDFHSDGTLRPDLTIDGLHLNAQGYSIWRNHARQYLADIEQ